MPFIKSISILPNSKLPFPFGIPAVRLAKKINLDNPVTIFVGDNGCGKSTILESIAYHLNLPLIGGFIENRSGFEAARLIEPFLDVEWKRETKKGFFFRAEDFSDFINSVQNEENKIFDQLRDLKGIVDDAIIQQMTESANSKLRFMRKEYGDNMQAYSHGEAYLKILQTRISGKGIYLLDEPEAALSPLKQLSLLSFILTALKNGDSQFIIATHSPIIMGVPVANLYQIQEDSLEQVKFRETEHYSITRNFLENPDYFLRYL